VSVAWRPVLLVLLVVACESNARQADALAPGEDVQAAGAGDLEPTDGLAKDGAPDGPADASVDLASDAKPEAADAVTPDLATDAPLDVVTPSRAAFRLLTLEMAAPDLCYPPGEACQPLNALASQILQGAIDDPDEPLVLVGLFRDFLEPASMHALTFGAGTCQGSGITWSCALDNADPAAVATFDVHYVLEGECGAGVVAPCFQSEPRDVLLDLAAFGGSLGLRQATLRGAFSTKDTIEGGGLRGFLPRALAEKYVLSGVGAVPVPLADLFADAPSDLDGLAGWWVSLRWWAVKVSWSE